MRYTPTSVVFKLTTKKKTNHLLEEYVSSPKPQPGIMSPQISSPSGQQRIITHLHVPLMNHQHFIWKEKVTQAVQK